MVPGTDCAAGHLPDRGRADAAQEAHEGEAVPAPGDCTVTDVYDGSAYNGGTNSSFFGEIGLAADSDNPLIAPTEVATPRRRGDRRRARRTTTPTGSSLDDGSSTNYTPRRDAADPIRGSRRRTRCGSVRP